MFFFALCRPLMPINNVEIKRMDRTELKIERPRNTVVEL